MIGDAVNLASRVEAKTRDTGDPVLITEATRLRLSETIEVLPRGQIEIKGYGQPVDLYAPVIPKVVVPGEPGADVSDPGLNAPLITAADKIGLGRPAGAGDGLGRAAPGSLGRPGGSRGGIPGG